MNNLQIDANSAIGAARQKDKLIVATAALCGCFGCHMSLLDIDERILQLVDLVEFDRTPLTDIKTVGKCDIGLIEGGVANVDNVEVLREFRNNCEVLVAVGACAVNGGIPDHAQPVRVEGMSRGSLYPRYRRGKPARSQ